MKKIITALSLTITYGIIFLIIIYIIKPLYLSNTLYTFDNLRIVISTILISSYAIVVRDTIKEYIQKNKNTKPKDIMEEVNQIIDEGKQ